MRHLLQDDVIIIDGCDSAIVGTDMNGEVAIYSWQLLILHFMEEFRCDCPCDCEKNAEDVHACGLCDCECDLYTMAVEWVDYNIFNALGNYGDKAPQIIDLRSPYGEADKADVHRFFPMFYGKQDLPKQEPVVKQEVETKEAEQEGREQCLHSLALVLEIGRTMLDTPTYEAMERAAVGHAVETNETLDFEELAATLKIKEATVANSFRVYSDNTPLKHHNQGWHKG